MFVTWCILSVLLNVYIPCILNEKYQYVSLMACLENCSHPLYLSLFSGPYDNLCTAIWSVGALLT